MGAEASLRFARAGQRIERDALEALLHDVGGPNLVPLQNPELLATARAVVAEAKAKALAEKAGVEELTSFVAMLRPEGQIPFEDKLVGLARSAAQWREAARRLELELPPAIRTLVDALARDSEAVAREVDSVRRSIDDRVDQRRNQFRRARVLEQRAGAMEEALAFAESLANEPEVLKDVERALAGRDEVQLSEVVASYEALDGPSPGAPNPGSSPQTEARRALVAAVERWARLEEDAAGWRAARSAAKGFEAAQNAAKPALEAIRALEGAGNKGATSLLDPPPLAQPDLERLARAANRLLAITSLDWSWSVDIALKRQRPAVTVRAKRADGTREEKLDLANLSTGQKTLVCVALALALNLLARDALKHSVIILDDFGTALDLAQLPAFAFLVRALAYSPEPLYRRQIVLASHHEDMTDRFIDLLAPPQGGATGGRLLVHAFEEWTLEEGPTFTTYELRDGSAGGDEVESRRIFERLVSRGVREIEERY
jgi:hypothetical protein